MKQIKQIVAQRQAISWLARLQSDNIKDLEKDQFFSWLEKSSINQAAYIQAESLWEKGEILIRQSDDERQLSQLFSLFRPQTVFYSGISIACAVFLYLVFIPSISTEIIYTEKMQQKTISLNDGSLLTLNPNTRLSVTMSRDHRYVTLHSGEVFFDVASDHSRPFEVETELGIVRVLGTKFSVRNTRTPQTTHQLKDSKFDVIVTVLEGKVGVIPQVKDSDSQKIDADYTLVKNEQISLNEAALGNPIRTVDATFETAWKKGQLIYQGEPLRKVIQDLEYYNNVKIEVPDSALMQEKLHATLRIDDIQLSLNTIVHALDLDLETIHTPENISDIATPTSYIIRSK